MQIMRSIMEPATQKKKGNTRSHATRILRATVARAVQAANSCKTKTDTRDLCRRWPDYTSHYMLRWCCHMYFGRHPDNYFGLDKFAYLTPSSIYRYPRSSQECGLANCAASNGLMSISKPGDPYAPTGRRLGKIGPTKTLVKTTLADGHQSRAFLNHTLLSWNAAPP